MTSTKAKATPFVDWYGIWAGHGGAGKDGLSWIQDPPLGDLRLAVQEGIWSEPQFTSVERSWEAGGVTPNHIVYQDGTLKMWYRATGENATTYVAYAESDDGFSWRRPEVGLVEYNGSKANNLLHEESYHGLYRVFRDNSAPPEERYKSTIPRGRYYVDGVVDSNISKEEFKKMRHAMQHEGFAHDEIKKKLEIHQIIIGAVSPDGLRWTVLEEPLRDLGSHTLDGEYSTLYDEERGEYVAYHRGHWERRRSIRRSSARKFDEWNDPQFVFMPDAQDPIDVDVYAAGYCRYPGGDLHLMFLPFYHRNTSTVDIQLATSRDGLLWGRPERVPIIARGVYGCLYTIADIVPLDDETWGLMFVGNPGRHDFRTDPMDDRPREPADWRWATWKRERLVALESSGEARFTTVQRTCSGAEMRLNYQTETGGWVKVELVHPPVTPPKPVEPFPGFGSNEADVMVGDELSRVVSWKGQSDLSELKGREVSVRIHMARAKLYSIAI